MIEHLSARQISEWMLGERDPQLAQHVAQCPQCSAELKHMENSLSQFRSAMRDPRLAAPVPVWRAPMAAQSWFSWPRMVLAAAMLLVLVAAPVSWRAHVREQQLAAAVAADSQLADSQLLERVDSAISQAVPEPMEPLVSLVSWNSSAADSAQKGSR